VPTLTRLDADTIVAAGLDLLRRDGVDAVTLRAVSAELGVTPMALYRHVGDAATLHRRTVLAAVDGLPGLGDRGPWLQRYRRWAHRARAFLLPLPGLPRHVLLHWTELPPVLGVVEQLLAAAPATPAPDAVAASNAVFTYVLLRADAEQAFVRGNHLHRSLEHLGDELPLLRRHADEYAVARLDEHFAYGLDALLAGVASARRRSSRGAPDVVRRA
jgi:AcrR family transcriptional regulator